MDKLEYLGMLILILLIIGLGIFLGLNWEMAMYSTPKAYQDMKKTEARLEKLERELCK